ncbi:hypothetical protein PT974_01280 [Cladobotryum mycophilum]|uniref:DUF676 domain-containing protein n=1 Tax=Cladobotryum mycophilum TaxID=491253 RepID=A0ABR0T4P6_9HYPO
MREDNDKLEHIPNQTSSDPNNQFRQPALHSTAIMNIEVDLTMALNFVNPFHPFDLQPLLPRDYSLFDLPSVFDIDIVAVHGMNIEGNICHYQDDWATNDGQWIRRTLPDYTGYLYRAMLFSYNRAFSMDERDTRLSEHSDRLLTVLQARRQNDPQRPLMFICHDLGGVVVKDALVKASQNPLYKDVADSTKLLVFFNTPHNNVASVARNLAESSVRVPEEELIRKLEAECHKAEERAQSDGMSRRLWRNRLVVNFYATNTYLGQKLIVEKKSTLVGLPDTREKHLPIYADHVSMCKLGPSNDEACRMVMKTISMEMDRALAMFESN